MGDILTLDSIPEAFGILEVAPYLACNNESSALLKKHFVKLTRQYHPDLLPPDSDDAVREEAEAKLAALNAAFIAQRDLKDRVDLLLEKVKEQKPSLLEKIDAQKLPPQYALQYFEIQEALEETPSSPRTKAQLDEFTAELHALSKQIDADILKIASKHPLNPQSIGSEKSDERKTWTLEQNDLELLARLRGQQKYADRLINDLDAFVGRLNC